MKWKEKLLAQLPPFHSWDKSFEGSEFLNKAVEDKETGRNPVLWEVRALIENL